MEPSYAEFWLDVINKLGVPTAMLIVMGIGARSVWLFITPFITRFMNAVIDMVVALGEHLPRQTAALEDGAQIKKQLNETLKVQLDLMAAIKNQLKPT